MRALRGCLLPSYKAAKPAPKGTTLVGAIVGASPSPRSPPPSPPRSSSRASSPADSRAAETPEERLARRHPAR